jgi:branched-chain amino acid transport system ATP-binding protein
MPLPDPGGSGLELRAIGVQFGGLVALDDVSLEVPAASVVGVIGPNGAGKTTLFNVVCGFIRPDRGMITWQGVPLRPKPQDLNRLGIARTLQGVGLFDGLTVLENVMAGATYTAKAGFASALFGLPRSDRDERRLKARAMEKLEMMGVSDRASQHPATLPFALRKRVALARALNAEPKLLLLDEPASGLSAEDVEALADLIRELRGEHSVMLVEHHMDLVMKVCDTIVVLDFGKVIATGKPTEIQDNPAVTDAYLGTEAGTEPTTESRTEHTEAGAP